MNNDTKQNNKYVEEFREKFEDENNRGIVSFLTEPIWKGSCTHCGMKFEGKIECEKYTFGHKNCPVRNKDPHRYFKIGIQTKEIEQWLLKTIEEVEKAFGGCTKCYGKGYGTGTDSRKGKSWSTIEYCTCSRGMQLKSINSQIKT